ncbi:hypothetical protein E2C06_25945 [Dankookia rubra]|uniref:Uncharacterized protein n=1 Tax=Dankookia rubra TaxID=1442381 RepID=A0A4R5QBS2_9PROT|nr:hypothetical protein [Dankookia rubra]TDH59727.1 hypothetical protein E2C06_25945 [Dankookia rubra]
MLLRLLVLLIAGDTTLTIEVAEVENDRNSMQEAGGTRKTFTTESCRFAVSTLMQAGGVANGVGGIPSGYYAVPS